MQGNKESFGGKMGISDDCWIEVSLDLKKRGQQKGYNVKRQAGIFVFLNLLFVVYEVL